MKITASLQVRTAAIFTATSLELKLNRETLPLTETLRIQEEKSLCQNGQNRRVASLKLLTN